jgi:hypothetical protein
MNKLICFHFSLKYSLYLVEEEEEEAENTKQIYSAKSFIKEIMPSLLLLIFTKIFKN